MGIPKEREKGVEEIFELIMTENFPKLVSQTKPWIQEAQETPSRKKCRNNNNKNTCRHTIFKLQKVDDKENTRERSRS